MRESNVSKMIREVSSSLTHLLPIVYQRKELQLVNVVRVFDEVHLHKQHNNSLSPTSKHSPNLNLVEFQANSRKSEHSRNAAKNSTKNPTNLKSAFLVFENETTISCDFIRDLAKN